MQELEIVQCRISPTRRKYAAETVKRTIGLGLKRSATYLQRCETEKVFEEAEAARKELAWWESQVKRPTDLLRRAYELSPAGALLHILSGRKQAKLTFEPVEEKEIGFPPGNAWLGASSYKELAGRIDDGSLRLIAFSYVGVLFWDLAWGLAQFWELPGVAKRGKRRIPYLIQDWVKLNSSVEQLIEMSCDVVPTEVPLCFDAPGFGKCESVTLSSDADEVQAQGPLHEPEPAPSHSAAANDHSELAQRFQIIIGGFSYGGNDFVLSGKPLQVLREFHNARGQRRSAADLQQSVWGDDSQVGLETVKNAVSDVREVLRKAARTSGLNIKDPIPCVDRGKNLAWRLAFPQ